MQSLTSTPVFTIGTRGSPLAVRQAEEVRDRLVAINGLDPDAIATVSYTHLTLPTIYSV